MNPSLFLGKRFEFSASHSHELVPGGEKFCHGHNFSGFLYLKGRLDSETGMVVELSKIKDELNKHIIDKLDHQFLNAVTSIFPDQNAKSERVAVAILEMATAQFVAFPVEVVGVKLQTTDQVSVTAYHDELVKTMEIPPSWYYQNLPGVGFLKDGPISIRVSLSDSAPKASRTLRFAKRDGELRDFLDLESGDRIRSCQTYTDLLSVFSDIYAGLPGFSQVSLETATLRLSLTIDGRLQMSIRDRFFATHRLWKKQHSVEENAALFGKCASDHGHEFKTTSVFEWSKNEGVRAENDLRAFTTSTVDAWRYNAINNDAYFENRLSTCEEISVYLWNQLSMFKKAKLKRVFLQETFNNVFYCQQGQDLGDWA